MDRKIYVAATGALAISVGLLAAAAAGSLAYLVPVENSALASWAQAVGTVLAIGATIWLATREDRRRRVEAHELAIVTASSMALRLQGAVHSCVWIHEQVDFTSRFDGAPESIKGHVTFIDGIIVSSTKEREKLVALPGRCAYKLAGVQDRLQAARNTLTSLDSTNERLNGESRKDAYKLASLALGDAVVLLKDAAAQCQSVARAVLG